MDNKETIRTFDSQTKYGDGGKLKPSFKEYYKTIPAEKNDTTNYNLKRAYELLPYEDMVKFATSDGHLSTVGYNKQNNSYEFLKSKNHPTIKYELDWYNSNDSEAVKFKNEYNLDTTGEYYKYLPKKQQGGYVRTSKSGRQFVYPSIQEKKQEIINKLMKTTNKPDD